MIRSLLFVIFLIGSFTSMGWSQADPNEAVRLQAELNNAKANLEAARQERDKIVAHAGKIKKLPMIIGNLLIPSIKKLGKSWILPPPIKPLIRRNAGCKSRYGAI
jgi:hypothetical protein